MKISLLPRNKLVCSDFLQFEDYERQDNSIRKIWYPCSICTLADKCKIVEFVKSVDKKNKQCAYCEEPLSIIYVYILEKLFTGKKVEDYVPICCCCLVDFEENVFDVDDLL